MTKLFARITPILLSTLLTTECVLSFFEYSFASSLPQRRNPQESYITAAVRSFESSRSVVSSVNALFQESESAFSLQTNYENLDFSKVPAVPQKEIIIEMYQRLRDSRSWFWSEMPDFPRRLTWLYPDDGCYLRADLMVQKLAEWNYPRPMQVFAFGELGFSSPYETISWWYHVAPIFQNSGQVYVLDPSIDYRQPLPLQQWIKQITNHPETLLFSLCQAGAVSPDDPCDEINSTWPIVDRHQDLQYYLSLEWTNLERILGESPKSILGDSPPWFNVHILNS